MYKTHDENYLADSFCYNNILFLLNEILCFKNLFVTRNSGHRFYSADYTVVKYKFNFHLVL